MDALRIEGGKRLEGTVRISGAKNAALPLLCTSLLADGSHIFRNVPDLRDIRTTAKLLEYLGLEVKGAPPTLRIERKRQAEPHAPYELVKQMRASVLVLGPLVARYGTARVSLPGGCAIGARPIDQHLKGLEAMGAKVKLEHGYVDVEVPGGRLQGANFDFDMVSVTGTENLMAAAALAKGRTRLGNAAQEPEVVDLAIALNKMGARVSGAGTSEVIIEGVKELAPIDHAIIPDRIEAGTYMAAAAITGGDILLENAPADYLPAVIDTFRQAGFTVESEKGGLRVVGNERYRSVGIETAPHPLFPTDMQAQWMAVMCLAQGHCEIKETIFENRFMHVAELKRMGADIEVQGNSALVRGTTSLQGAQVMATDLRASASLVVAGLAAQGVTEVLRVYHLDRGYEHIEEKLEAVGATIERVPGTL